MRWVRGSSGVSLIELLFATVIISVVLISVGATVQRLQRAQRHRGLQRLAQQLAQDQLEQLKSHPFPYIHVTAGGDAPGDGCLSGDRAYDRNPEHYPPEIFNRSGMRLLRQTCVEWVQPSQEGALVRADPDNPTGLKRIVVRVLWPAEKPELRQEMASVISNPAGAMSLTGREKVTVRVNCTRVDRLARPCGDVWLYLYDVEKLCDVAESAPDGSAKFTHAPSGSLVIRPQLQSGETAEPMELRVSLPMPDHAKTPTLTITRTNALLHLKTNRENTLVAVMPGLPTDQPPDILLRRDQDNGVYGRVIFDSGKLVVSPGFYSVRCWAPQAKGPLQVADPIGGLNTLIEAGGSYAFECRF